MEDMLTRNWNLWKRENHGARKIKSRFWLNGFELISALGIARASGTT